MKTTLIGHCLFLGAIGLCLAATAQAETRLLVQVPAVFDPSAPVADSVRRECGIESMIGNHVFQQVSEAVPNTLQTQGPGTGGDGAHLGLTVLAVQGVGGGSWSGAKSITLRADLSRDGKVFASQVLQRGSRGGAFGGLSGTCAIMERIAVALGRDTRRWLGTLAWSTPAALAADGPATASGNGPAGPDTH